MIIHTMFGKLWKVSLKRMTDEYTVAIILT